MPTISKATVTPLPSTARARSIACMRASPEVPWIADVPSVMGMSPMSQPCRGVAMGRKLNSAIEHLDPWSRAGFGAILLSEEPRDGKELGAVSPVTTAEPDRQQREKVKAGPWLRARVFLRRLNPRRRA